MSQWPAYNAMFEPRTNKKYECYEFQWNIQNDIETLMTYVYIENNGDSSSLFPLNIPLGYINAIKKRSSALRPTA
jgi:hypothetical protein